MGLVYVRLEDLDVWVWHKNFTLNPKPQLVSHVRSAGVDMLRLAGGPADNVSVRYMGLYRGYTEKMQMETTISGLGFTGLSWLILLTPVIMALWLSY